MESEIGDHGSHDWELEQVVDDWHEGKNVRTTDPVEEASQGEVVVQSLSQESVSLGTLVQENSILMGLHSASESCRLTR